MSVLWQQRGNTLDIFPHPGQWQAWQSERRFTFMLSGTQAGKTSFLPLWLWREIQTCGPGDYLAVTATFPLLQLKLLPAFLDIFQHTLHLGEYKASARVFEYRRQKTRVIFGSATHPESLESATAKAAILDEFGQDAFRLQSWEAVQRRLSLYQGRVLGGTTIYNLGWVKQQIYARWLAGDPDIAIIQFPSIQNPEFPKAEFERQKASLAQWKFRMFYLGQFDLPPGLIYVDYQDMYREEGGHLVYPFNLPPEWPRYVGVDPGAVNTATVWIAHDPEVNVYYVYHCTLSGGKTTNQHAAEALEQAQGTNVQSWHLGAKSEVQQRLDWGEAGVSAWEPRITDVEAGIDRVIALFKTRRLFVFDTCTGLRDELGSYSRVVDDNGQPTEKIKDKETYHHCFVAGTLVRTLDGDCPIEMVQTGTLVLTRRGYRKVLAAGKQGVASVIKVALSNGKSLTGTSNHPVYVCGNGFASMGTLRYGDVISLLPYKENLPWRERRLISTGLLITVIRKLRTNLTECILSMQGRSYIGRSGSENMGIFLTASRFITKTITQTTMRLLTSRWFRPACIAIATMSASVAQQQTLISTESVPLLLHGIDQMKDANGTDSTERMLGSRASRLNAPAMSAAMYLCRLLCDRITVSALTSVRVSGGGTQGLMTLCGHAFNVASHLRRTNTLAPTTVHYPAVHVLHVTSAGEAQTYNLTVDDAHEYYANGVLVRNCDALRYVVGGLSGERDVVLGFA